MWVAFVCNVVTAFSLGGISFLLVKFLFNLYQMRPTLTTEKCKLIRMLVSLVVLLGSLYTLCGFIHVLSAVQTSYPGSVEIDCAKLILLLLLSVDALATLLVCFKVFPTILVKLVPEIVPNCDENQMYDNHYLKETVEAVRESIVVLSHDLTIVRENECSKTLFVSSTLCGKSILDFIHPEDLTRFESAAQAAIANYSVTPITVEYRIKPVESAGSEKSAQSAESAETHALASSNIETSPKSYKRWKMSRVHNCEQVNDVSARTSASVSSVLVDVKKGGDMQVTYVWLESTIFTHMFTDNNGVLRTTLEMVSRSIDERKGKEQNHLDSRLKETEEQKRIDAAKLRYLSCIAHDLKTPLQSFCYTLDLLQQTELQAEQRTYIEQANVAVDLMKLTISQTMDISKALTGAKLFPRRTTVILSSIIKKVDLIISGYCKQVPVSFAIAPTIVDEIITDEEWLWQMLLNLLTNACKYTDRGSIAVKVSLSKNPNPRSSEKSYTLPFNQRARASLFVDARMPTEMLLFEVVDTGVGVADDKLPIMFEAFAQVQDGQTTGTGLGLYGLSLRAEGLQGSCGARHNTESPTGTGTIMWFAIPYVANRSRTCSNVDDSPGSFFSTPSTAAASAIREAAATEVPSHSDLVRAAQEILGSRPVTAMVVEDTLTVRKLMERMLLQMGFASVIGYENGSKGLDAMMAGSVDIVFSDVQMPIMTGPEMVSRFRKFEENALASGARSKRQMVVAVTANGTELDDMANIGFDGVYAKPLSRNDIYKIVNRHL